MEFLLLIVVAGLYYIIYLTAVMYSEKIVVLPIIIYAIVFVIIGITYIFIGDSYDQLTNFNVILYMGSLFYAWMAIRNLWNRPLLLKYKNITDSSKGNLKVSFDYIDWIKLGFGPSGKENYYMYKKFGILPDMEYEMEEIRAVEKYVKEQE